MFLRLTLYWFILPLVESSMYLYNTRDSLSVEFYDCITDTNLPYCRRPSEPIALERDQRSWYCDHGGISHSFSSLFLKNVSVSIVLHEWSSSIEKAEEYARYKRQRQSDDEVSSNEKYLCECTNPRSFGKRCEYRLPMGTTFLETIAWEIQMKKNNIWDMHRYSDIVCYTTLICNSGLLCLDWRDICDGVQHCMYGYDEENCDKLEFNECEDDEYRCMNGMCIPDQYFLDGEYDCADLTDEKESFNDKKCTFQPASYECDDRICLRSLWSCGDGQCILDQLEFLSTPFNGQCQSLREQYHMCELHARQFQWTLPNGKCYQSSAYEENAEKIRTDLEECLYFVKCALSQGIEKNCPCKKNVTCINELENPCSSSMIQYPNGAIIAPYAFSFYNTSRDWSRWMPDDIIINGTLKCRRYMIEQSTTLTYRSRLNLQQLEAMLCASESTRSILSNNGYDEFCYNNSRTFNNRPYHFIDVCKVSKECISAYRIKDGYGNCAYSEDETLNDQFPNTCSNIQRHRFRCSNDEPRCLFVSYLGDEIANCRNSRDEWWMKGGIKLSKLICNSQSKDDCGRIRQYIEASWTIDTNNSTDQQLELPKISFRSFCNTFWNWGSKEDENIEMCHKWWKCPGNQWQCRSGQCIEIEWVLDGEWDCVDASDEQALFVPTNNFSLRNLNLINNKKLIKDFKTLYSNQSFWTICNLSVEYPCFRANVSDPLNITHNRPCINLNQIGDGHVDCAGGLDERNTLKNCRYSTMLGYYFQCSSTETCVAYYSHCSAKCDDNHVQCFGYKQTSNCSEDPDFMCLDGKCAKYGRCNYKFDCSHGEDEFFCVNRISPIVIDPLRLYRDEKELSVRTTKQKLQLPQLFINIHENKVADKTISMKQSETPTINFFSRFKSIIPYYCNRGIGVELYDDRSFVCFCPPQYYGERCQFHNDRITFLFHLNLTQSIYVESKNPKMMLKLLIIFLHNNQPLMTESFQIKVIDKIIVPRKKLVHLLYSRSDSSLHDKRVRYFNRSNIISEHPYSIRIEAYELNPSEKPQLVGVWLYPIYFDFLPSFRLAKVLHLTKSNTINNPCSSSPCNLQQQCQQILNQKSTYVCLCRSNFTGENCSIIDEMCERGFCSADALCKPNYRGILIGNEQPYCICPLNEIGHQCGLIHDQCDSNPCQNNGTCLSTSEVDQFMCLCDDFHYGDQCQLEKQGVRLQIKNSPDHRAAVVQYFDINFFTLDLILVDQYIHDHLPDLLYYLHIGKTAPGIIVVKFYSDTENDIYLISIQIDVESIDGTIELNETNRCVHVQSLFDPTNESNEIIPFKYHHLCVQNSSLLCFVDNSYLCICEDNHHRTECFGYDHNLDQCSECLSDGKCLIENRLKSDFVCLCPQCYYGSLCQFSIEGIGFTLDSLIIQISRSIRLMYLILSFLIFIIGGLTNYASVITFKRSNLRKTSMSIYMLILSLMSQYSLFSLIMKIILILFDSIMNDLSCKLISYMHSISIRCSFWLTSLIAIERVSYVLFPYSTVLKKRRIAIIITIITILIVGVMHVHEFIFYRKLIDLNGQSICVVDFPLKLRTYDRITVLLHYLIPFSIQILSITMLIIFAARSRSRTGNNRDPFVEYLKRQFRSQKDLYIPPTIIILSSLPQTILSFSFACLELVRWQQHALLIAYFLSFAPQLLGFVLFVLPSTNYMKEFESTKLSKTFFFRWIISKKKTQRKN